MERLLLLLHTDAIADLQLSTSSSSLPLPAGQGHSLFPWVGGSRGEVMWQQAFPEIILPDSARVTREAPGEHMVE